MTKVRAEYFENKYKLFIKVWQTSDTVEEARLRLQKYHGWYDGMEATGSDARWYREQNRLTKATVQSYAYRLRRKDIELKQMQEEYEREWSVVDYEMLGEYAMAMAGSTG